jgi:hypothetical protein
MDFESNSKEKKKPTNENEKDDKDMAMGLEALSRVKKGKGEKLSDFMQKRLDDIKDKTSDGNIEEMIKNDPERSEDWADLNKGLGQLEEIKREKKETVKMQEEDYKKSLEKIKKLQQETGMDLSQTIESFEKVQEVEQEDGEKPDDMEEKEEKMKKEGKKYENELKVGDKFNIMVALNSGKDIAMDFNPKEHRIEFTADNKKTSLTAGEIIGMGFNVSGNPAEQKYLSVFDGKLIISGLDYQKKAADDYIKNDPNRLEDFKKTIQSFIDQKKPIPPLFQHVNETYFQKKDGVGKEEVEQQNTRGTESASDNNMEDEGGKEQNFESEKEEAEGDFLKTLESFEILHGEMTKEKKKKIIDETLKEIRTAADDDYIDLALAKGIKKARQAFAEMKREK